MEHRSIDPARCRAFRRKIYAHYAAAGRDFPWRHTRDPYHVMVSEIMLQQTQTGRVAEKFPAFIAAFPTVRALAAARLGAVLKVWQGMGYNRRALFLHRAAQEIVRRFGGIVPQSIDDLESLPGIGPATARSVAAYAFGAPTVFIETNIRTIFIHEFFRDRDDVADAEILPLVERTLDRRDPWTWYNALMDYGVMLKEKHPNPGRRSAHYGRQAPFGTSDRRIRGRIIALLAGTPLLGRAQLHDRIDAVTERVDHCLDALRREGMVCVTQGKYRLP